MTAKRQGDFEIMLMHRLCRDLAALQPDARRRVIAYVFSRIDTLPVIAAVGGGIDDGETAGMFDEPHDPVPTLPHMKGAA